MEGWKDGRTNGRTNGLMDGRTGEGTDGRMHARTDRQIEGQTGLGIENPSVRCRMSIMIVLCCFRQAGSIFFISYFLQFSSP